MKASLAGSNSRVSLLHADVHPESSLGVHFVGLPLMILTVVGVAVAPLSWGYWAGGDDWGGDDWDGDRFGNTILEITQRYNSILNANSTFADRLAATDWLDNCVSKLKQVTSPSASAEAWAEVEEICNNSPNDDAELLRFNYILRDSQNCTVQRASVDSAASGLAGMSAERLLVLALVVVSYAALLMELCWFVSYWNKFMKSHLADASCLSDLSPDAMYTVKSLSALVLLVLILVVLAFAIGSFVFRSPDGRTFPSNSHMVSTSLIMNSLTLLVYAVVRQLQTIGL